MEMLLCLAMCFNTWPVLVKDARLIGMSDYCFVHISFLEKNAFRAVTCNSLLFWTSSQSALVLPPSLPMVPFHFPSAYFTSLIFVSFVSAVTPVNPLGDLLITTMFPSSVFHFPEKLSSDFYAKTCAEPKSKMERIESFEYIR